MEKNFIVDTNIFINDPDCIMKFGDGNNVIVPIVVIEELDSFKNEDSGRARAARQATRSIHEISKESDKDLNEGIKLESGGKLYVKHEIPEVDFTQTEANNKNDSLILQFAKDLDKQKDNVKLITEDTNLYIRAEAWDIDAEGYKNIEASNKQLYEPTTQVHCQPQEINQIYQKGKINVSKSSIKDTFHENEGAIIKAGDQNALVRYTDGEINVIQDKDVDQTYGIQPRNAEQAMALDLLLDDTVKLVCLSGKAGVGKTLLALAAGLQKTMHDEVYEKITVARPTVAMGNELGFTPGDVKDKLQPWMAPIYDNIDYLFKRDEVHGKVRNNPIENLEMFDQIEVMALTYIRGRSISDEFVIIDELQNCNPHEIKTIVTRAAEGTKIVCTGDPYQIDNPYVDQYSNGLSYLIDRMEGQDIFGYVNLVKGERSELAETASDIL